MAGATGAVSGTPSAFVPDEQSVEQLINFGFTRAQCVKALKCTSGNMERAADWLFSHPDDTGKIIALGETRFGILAIIMNVIVNSRNCFIPKIVNDR